jgi:hypothetical protein
MFVGVNLEDEFLYQGFQRVVFWDVAFCLLTKRKRDFYINGFRNYWRKLEIPRFIKVE